SPASPYARSTTARSSPARSRRTTSTSARPTSGTCRRPIGCCWCCSTCGRARRPRARACASRSAPAPRAWFASHRASRTACGTSRPRPGGSSTSPMSIYRPSRRRATRAGCRGITRAPRSGKSFAGRDVKLLVTGGCGFIGSNFIRHVLATHAADRVVNLDKLTYAGNPANLADLANDSRYTFVQGDVCDAKVVRDVIRGVDAVVNFAAESHVDRSLMEPDAFLRTDVFGVFALLEAVKELKIARFLHISTDEVYGSVERGSSRESDPVRPSNPYSASKAGGDLLALAYWHTHRVPVLITRSSNNFGPHQYPEKVIPLFVTNALDDKPLPLYGDGRNVRDWLYVLDNCAGIDLVLRKGGEGEVYNIGGGHEVENIVLTRQILQLTGKPETLIQPVKDRPGHDRRYSVDSKKVHQLGWAPRHRFGDALRATVEWYREHESWWRPLKSGEFRAYYERQYGRRWLAIT